MARQRGRTGGPGRRARDFATALTLLAAVAVVAVVVAACGGSGGGTAGGGDAGLVVPGPSLPCGPETAPPTTLVRGGVRTADVDPQRPARGSGVTEPAYGTCVLRVTDHAADGLPNFARNDYSRRQAFNADDSRQLVYASDGSWHLYDRGFRHVGRLAALQADAEPQWDPVDPDRIDHLPPFGIGMQVLRLSAASGRSTVIGDLGPRLRQRWPSASAASTRSEGSPSADGRFWCLLVVDADFGGLGLVTWDRDTDTVLGLRDLGADRPDHVSMSPSGRYCVASHYSETGVIVYDRDLGNPRRIAALGEHSDIGLDAEGDDIYVSIDYASNDGSVYLVNLRTGVRRNLFGTYIAGTGSAMHFSAKAFRRPGWFVISAYGGGSQRPPYVPQWFHRRIVVVSMTADPVAYTVASTHALDAGYWAEPQASVNRDLTRIVWTSNWNVASETDLDVYQVRLAAEALQPR